jgi:hypothetical protein
MKIYWLYFFNILITSVRCSEKASRDEIIIHALKNHDLMPCGGGLFPRYTPATIRNLIWHSEIR